MATTMEAPDTVGTATKEYKGARQFQGLFEAIPFKVAIDEDSIAGSATSVADVTVAGAALGDLVIVWPTIDVVDVQVTAWVQSANTVSVMLQNTEVADATTALAANPTFNGLILKPNKNVLAWAP